jgi:EmrB/QacA subfamily drug resistance transporter
MHMFAGPDKRQKILTLATMCFALFMAMLDNTVVNVALPAIQKHLNAGFSGLQWIVDGYVLAFCSLLLTGGIIGDRYGRKKTFMSGLFLFTLASLACGLSANTSQLIGFRVLQGVGAALLMPGTLSIITVTFPAQERAKAIGIWAGISGLALAAGPPLGGWMVEHVGWQSVFFLNVPIGIAGLIVASFVIKESRSEIERRLDIPGLLLGTSALFGAVYALIEVNERGWGDPLIIGCFVAAGVLLITFLSWERHSEHAMIPLRFFRIPAFAAGNTVAFSVSLGMFAIFFFLSLYMQDIRRYDPVQAGLWFLPMTLMIVVTAPNAGRIASKIGSRYPMTIGLLMAGGGLMTLSFALGLTTNFWLIVPILMVMGAGMGMTMTPMTAAVMNAVGPQRAGMGSAMTNTSREVGGVFGIALLGTILSTALSRSIGKLLPLIPGLTPAQQAGIATAGHHGQLDPSVLAQLHVGPAQALAVYRAYGISYVHGFHYAMRTGATVLLVAAVVAYVFVPHGAPKHDGHERVPDLEPVAAG